MLRDAFQIADADAFLDEALEDVGDLLERQDALDFLDELGGLLFHVVEEKPRLLEGEEFVRVASQSDFLLTESVMRCISLIQ